MNLSNLKTAGVVLKYAFFVAMVIRALMSGDSLLASIGIAGIVLVAALDVFYARLRKKHNLQ